MGRRPLAALAGAAALLLLASSCGGEGAPDAGDADRGAAGPDAPAASPDTSSADPDATAGPGAVPDIALPSILSRSYQRDPAGKLRVLDELPAAADTAVETMPNRHDPQQTDSVLTFRWPGLELDVHVAGGKELLETVRVTGDGYATEDGLRVGLSREGVRTLRGEPERTEDGAWVYEAYDDEEAPNPIILRVTFEADSVSSLTWSYYVD